MARKELMQVLVAVVTVLLALIFTSSLYITVSCDDLSDMNEFERAELLKLMTFEEFLEQNPRDYVNDPAELERRRKIFDDNSIFIAKHNAGPEGEMFKMRPTDIEFGETVKGAILPEDEIFVDDDDSIDDGGGLVKSAMFTKKKPAILAFFSGKRERPVIPDGPKGSSTHIDSDLRYCALNFDVQGEKCGCCYAFAYNAYAEWHYCKLTNGGHINFSEQFIVNCGYKYGMYGCYGGKISVAKAMSRYVGFKLEKDLPYKAKNDKCSYEKNSENVRVEVSKWTRLKLDRAHWEEILMEQPIVVHVKLPQEYTVYDSGIHHGEDCSERDSHGMVLMGYGTENDEPYWILKNSQGLDWGESGYFRLSRKNPVEQCFEDGYVGRFKFATLPQESFDDFYDSLTVTPIKKEVPKKAQADSEDSAEEEKFA